MSNRAPFKLGILLLDDAVELMDLVGVNLFDMMTLNWMQVAPVSEAIKSKALEIDFHYISEAGPGSPFVVTGRTAVQVTDSFDTCPQVDILLVPGPPPMAQLSGKARKFLSKQVPGLVALLSVCSGIMPLLQSGFLDGKKVSGPRGLIPMLQGHFPTTKFNELRWEVDYIKPANPSAGNSNPSLSKFNKEENGVELWTSGGILNGLDMLAQFLREKFPDTAEFALQVSDAACRSQEYDVPVGGAALSAFS